MRTKNILNLVGGLLLVALVGCGGGGGSAGTPAGGTGGGTVPIGTGTAVVASDFIFELDKQSLASAGNEKALLTILAVDSNRNVVANVPVSISVDSGGVFSSASSGTLTDASGKYSGSISLGGNKTNRVVNAKISVSGIEKIASIQVIDSKISVTAVPATAAPGGPITINLSSIDSAGAAVPNVPVLISGTSGAAGTFATDGFGKRSFVFNAPSAPGEYLVTASGLGVTATSVIRVLSPLGGSFPIAMGVVSSVSLSPQPSSIAPNQSGVTTNRARLTARFLTSANVGVQNMRVRFEILQPALGSGEALSTGDAEVYSNVAGVAESEYIAGTRSSPTNGVLLRACYKASDFTSASDCPNFVSSTLTVAGTPLGISIGDDNKLEKGLGEIAYLKKFLIQVNDASGAAVKDAIVSVSVDITHFGKGNYAGTYPVGSIAPTISDPSIGLVQTGPTTVNLVQSPTIVPGTVTLASGTTTFANVWCVNEDINRNGALDNGEERNGDGILTPRKAEVIVAYSSGNTTNANGQMLVQVTYSQNVGSWLAYTLRATTRVAGSEGDASKSYITDVLKEDVSNGSFLTPPYGSGSCSVRR